MTVTLVATACLLQQVRTLKPETLFQFDRTLRQGTSKKAQVGKNGKQVLVEGKWVTETPPVDNIILINPGHVVFSRSSYKRGRVLAMTATAYTPYEGSSTGSTATTPWTKKKAGLGQIAVDPRVIPLGSYVFVEGYGSAIATDTGGAIKGNIIDVCFTSAKDMHKWGRRKVVVHVFIDRAFNLKNRKPF